MAMGKQTHGCPCDFGYAGYHEHGCEHSVAMLPGQSAGSHARKSGINPGGNATAALSTDQGAPESSISDAGDGNQLPSGLRGDPVAPRTVNDDTRDTSSSSESSLPPQALRALVDQMRRRVADHDRGPVAEWQVREWADHLASLLPAHQEDQT